MKNKKVILGMSGGVDSSVAALLLQKKGYEVIAMFMDCRNEKLPTSISWEDEQKTVKEICNKLQIKLIIKNCGEGYEKKVISKMFKDYQTGLTPNPDILCNNVGKFPLLYEVMKQEKANFIATGHYARIKRKNKKIKLLTGKDNKKDQSYFLVGVDKKYLEKCIFPIGNLTKEKVRKIAKKENFPNHNKKGSRGICYLGKIDMKKFLKTRIKTKEGKLTDTKGNIIGKHPGIEFFTIGETINESKGIELNKLGKKEYSSDKLYVCEKKKGNELKVCKKNDKALYLNKIIINNLKTINKEKNIYNKKIKCRIRHLGEFHKGKLVKQNKKNTFIPKKEIGFVAPGQYIVLYHKKQVLAAGQISG